MAWERTRVSCLQSLWCGSGASCSSVTQWRTVFAAWMWNQVESCCASLLILARFFAGRVTTIAGRANKQGTADAEVGTDARFAAPLGLALSADGNLLIADH